MTPFFLTLAALLGTLLIGEVALWRLLIRRFDPKRSVDDEDLVRTGLFPMERIGVAAICHAVALAIAVILPLFLLW